MVNDYHKAINKYIVFIILLLGKTSLFPQTVLYRYNSDYDNDDLRQTAVLVTNVSVDTRWDDEEETARGSEGWGYSTGKTSYFFQNTGSITTIDTIMETFIGPHTLSGELWLKPFESEGKLLFWGNSASSNSINISLINEGLTLIHSLEGETFELTAEYSFSLQRWHHLVWHSIISSDSINLGIYVNGQIIGKESFGLVAPGFVTYSSQIIIGHDQNDTIPGFKGEIYAANLKNYFLHTQYVISPPSFDGSAYSGIPNYHDYAIGSSTNSIDERITYNPTEVKDAVFVPYANDEFIPQGVTNSFEDEEYENDSTNMVFISLYHKTQNGTTGLKKSIIVELDPYNGYKIRRCFRLNGVQRFAHNGGIAFKNNHIYVASNYHIEKYEIPEYQLGADKYVDLYANVSDVYPVSSKASFVTYFEDTLWIGDYRGSSENDIPYLFGYPIDLSGDIISPANPTIYRLPIRSQGVAWARVGSDKYLFISQSNGGSNYGSIYRCHLNGLTYSETPVIDTVFSIPAGAEDLSFNGDGDLFTVSESGAKYFHESWSMFYPFVYSIPNQTMLENIGYGLGTIINENLHPQQYKMRVYPNPFNGKVNIEYILGESGFVDLKINNILGQQIYLDETWLNAEDMYSNKIDLSSHGSGVYLISLIINGMPYSREKIIYLK